MSLPLQIYSFYINFPIFFPWVTLALQKALKTTHGLPFRTVNPTADIITSTGFYLLCISWILKLLLARSWGCGSNENVLDFSTELVWIQQSAGADLSYRSVFVYVVDSRVSFHHFLKGGIDALSAFTAGLRCKNWYFPCPASVLSHGVRHHSLVHLQ